MATINTSVTVASTSTQALASNATRKTATFVNDSDEAIYLSLDGAATVNSGIRINASGGSYEITQDNPFNGTVNAICSSGGKNLVVMEVSTHTAIS